MNELLTGMGIILLYAGVLAAVAVALRVFTPIRDEVYRKMLHMIMVIATMFWPYLFEHWYMAAAASMICIVLFYALLAAAERFIDLTRFMTERRKGEFMTSVVLAFFMYAVVIAVCWGWRGERILTIAVISAWGYGDAAAALVGKRFGRHGIEGRHIEGRKSVEGSAAMFGTSFVCVLTVLLIRGGMAWYGCVLTALITALAAAVTELYSLDGRDTITCPFAAMACLLPLTWLFGRAA